jgi:hypothetical protein
MTWHVPDKEKNGREQHIHWIAPAVLLQHAPAKTQNHIIAPVKVAAAVPDHPQTLLEVSAYTGRLQIKFIGGAYLTLQDKPALSAITPPSAVCGCCCLCSCQKMLLLLHTHGSKYLEAPAREKVSATTCPRGALTLHCKATSLPFCECCCHCSCQNSRLSHRHGSISLEASAHDKNDTNLEARRRVLMLHARLA